jgi:tripartite-type tricarboxylate transporter receptor subunit TctC
MKGFIRILAALATLLAAVAINAQSIQAGSPAGYPARPVRVIVPYAAGGPTDAIARIIIDQLSNALGQQFYVVNHPGASGNLGMGIAAKAPGDGYTLLFVTNDLAAQPSLSNEVPYDPTKSFAPVTRVAAMPEVIVVHPSVPATTLKELIALLKANPGKYHYASPGARTTTHLSAERLFRLSNGLDLAHVPFGGGGPAIASTFAGHTLLAFTALPPAAPYISDGKLRALAVTSGKRSSAFPDVPTLEEAGYAGHESDLIVGVVAPAGTPKEIVDLLYREIARAAALPDVQKRLTVLGFEIVVNKPEEFAALIEAEIAKWARVAREANIEKR